MWWWMRRQNGRREDVKILERIREILVVRKVSRAVGLNMLVKRPLWTVERAGLGFGEATTERTAAKDAKGKTKNKHRVDRSFRGDHYYSNRGKQLGLKFGGQRILRTRVAVRR